MYFNYVGSVKLPAPVYYSHKLANQVVEVFDSQITIHPELKNLHFIWILFLIFSL